MLIQTLQDLKVSQLFIVELFFNLFILLGDYSEKFLSLNLPRNISRICGKINIINDVIREDLYENFTVKIDQVYSNISTLSTNTNPSTIRIQDDDC